MLNGHAITSLLRESDAERPFQTLLVLRIWFPAASFVVIDDTERDLSLRGQVLLLPVLRHTGLNEGLGECA